MITRILETSAKILGDKARFGLSLPSFTMKPEWEEHPFSNGYLDSVYVGEKSGKYPYNLKQISSLFLDIY